MTPADRFFGVEKAVEEAVTRAVEKNALRLAVGEAPRRPVYLVGQIDGQSVSVHGEGGKVVVQLPGGEVKEIEARDLGIDPKPATKGGQGSVRDEEDGAAGGAVTAPAGDPSAGGAAARTDPERETEKGGGS
jgi:hypothetical protein